MILAFGTIGWLLIILIVIVVLALLFGRGRF